MTRAAQIKAQIKALQKELKSLNVDVQGEKFAAFHEWCTTFFGRPLRVGDQLERYHYTMSAYNPISKSRIITDWERRVVKIVKPGTDWMSDVDDGVARIYYGHVYVDIKGAVPKCGPGFLTKTKLKKYKLLTR